MGKFKALLAANVAQVDAVEDHHESGVVNFDRVAGDVRREFESAFGELFVPEDEAIALPDEDFEAVASAVAKDEKISRQRVSAHERANLSRQAAEAHSHIGRS